MMYLEAHGYIFGSILQFKNLIQAVEGEVEDVVDPFKEEDVLMSDD